MPKSTKDEACLIDWQKSSAKHLHKMWKQHGNEAIVFIGTRNVRTQIWEDHSFKLPLSKRELEDFMDAHPRETYDLYACANSFKTNRRRAQDALDTNYVCVDVDDAPLASFKPQPTIATETSPGRYQAIWAFTRRLPVAHAEQIARNLAYSYGADKNGWSITKYLRIPFTYNHKPNYDLPEVRLLQFPPDISLAALVAPPFIPRDIKGKRSKSRTPKETRPLQTGRKHRLKVLQKYRSKLKLMARTLLAHDRVLYTDRSGAVFAMIAGLYEAGASRKEINAAIWNSVYFRDKYGNDKSALTREVGRILGKLEGRA